LEKIQFHEKGNIYKRVQIQIHSSFIFFYNIQIHYTHEKNVKQSFVPQVKKMSTKTVLSESKRKH